jgi:hypothetical protein
MLTDLASSEPPLGVQKVDVKPSRRCGIEQFEGMLERQPGLPFRAVFPALMLAVCATPAVPWGATARPIVLIEPVGPSRAHGPHGDRVAFPGQQRIQVRGVVVVQNVYPQGMAAPAAASVTYVDTPSVAVNRA